MADAAAVTARSALAELTLARVKEAARDPSAVLWTFAFPVFLALVLGFAFRDTKGADGRYIEYLMPGLVALNLMGSGVWGIGYSIVDQRRRRLIRQLATTPLRQRDYLLSYMLSRLVFLVPEVALLFGFGVLVFDVPLRGDLGALALFSLLGALAFTGVGVLIAARVDSAEAAAGWANLVMTPMWLCSGVFFAYDQFPSALHPLIRALPLTALSDALRAVARDAAPLSACTTELLVLAAWTLLSFGLALRLFRWP
jgi:ABC-2 type transport system permease protein